MQREESKEFILPRNIRQIGTFGDTYKVYVEDFVYTYVHQFMHRRKKEEPVLAAVLLGKTVQQGEQEYIFISGAQKVEFQMTEDSGQEQVQEESAEENTPAQEAVKEERGKTSQERETVFSRQQEFWDRVYQRIKQYFDDCEILGWYFNLDGSNLEVNTQLQQFFESTYKKGSRFLYYEDSLEKEDAFFVQEQHRLQRLTGYAVYYEKNPQMQEFMIAEKERLTPKPLRDSYVREDRDEVVQSYRAIMNKLNEKPQKKKLQPVIYVAGMAVLAVVVATGVSQIGNYQNLKVLEQTMQTLSGAVGETGDKNPAEEEQAAEEESVNGSAAEEPDAEEQNTGADAGQQKEEETSAASAGQTTSDTETSPESEDSQGGINEAEPAPDNGTEQAEAVQQTSDTPSDYYIVKRGDSLVSISKAIYNTSSKVEEICQLNNIENMDMIYEGQRLLLP